MAEMASSAIVGEVVGQIFSSIIDKYNDGSDGDSSNIERLEMACIKLDATIETSDHWQITDVALLRWRKKLKHVALECDDELRRCKKRSLEDKETKEKLRQSSFPRRVAHSTKSFLSSLVSHRNNGEPSSKAAVQRQICTLSNVTHQGSMLKCFSIRPMSFEERGLEAMLVFIHEDCKAPKENFRLGLMLRLSQSTDVIGITVKCLQLLTPHFNSISEVVIGELTQLPMQDFKWSPTYDEPGDMEHWNQVHDTLTRWFRSDPFCCKQHELQNMSAACSSSTNAPGLSGIFPEQVIGVFLQRHILLSEYRELQGSKMTCHSTSSFQEDVLLLKLGVLFMPHHPLEDIKFATEAESSAVEQLLDANVHPHQLDSLVLPKAVEYLHHNAEAMMYRMSWKSKHGSAHLCLQKTSKEMMGALGATTRQGWRNNSNAFLAFRCRKGNDDCDRYGNGSTQCGGLPPHACPCALSHECSSVIWMNKE
ncbi:unnamed protein product [Miscanthus lutarioriparius]|uniref:Rx N-terminal domain-containing protein n=1 Tax=Miscanthus lutarioriparius TaxID=422564 RepID=A0A811QAW4_9POAL|nr:unnamed protein product [Miscanthus lutarioriparius]